MLITQIKTSFLFSTFMLFVCLNSFFLGNSAAQVQDEPVGISANYTFERIDVPGVEFLAVTASSDFEDYAGYTLDPETGKEVGFTLIDGNFERHDFPGSQKTHFYALGNNGLAAGTTRIATVCITALSWKMASCSNTIFRVPCKRRYTVIAIRRGH